MGIKSSSLSVVHLSAAATNGDDFIDLGPGNSPEIDGMDGFDTVLLRPTEQSNQFGIYSPLFFRNIEAIQGSASSESVTISAEILRSLRAFDGGGSGGGYYDEILVHNIMDSIPGNTFDLSQTKVTNAKLDLGYFPSDLPVRVKVGHKETALAIHAQSARRVTVDASESGVTFTLAERNDMFRNGVDTVRDANGWYTYTPVTLTDFEETRIVRPGQGPIFLDEGQDAGVVFTPGGGSLELETSFGELGLDESGTVDLVQDGGVTRVRVDLPDDGEANGIDIGTLAISATSGKWRFQFNEDVSGEHIKEVIRNLTFAFDDTIPGGAVFDTSVTLKFDDSVSWVKTFYTHLFLVPTGAQMLDPAQNSAPATAGDDGFVASAAILRNNYTLAGGDGTDTLYLRDPDNVFELWKLAEFSGIERIVFHQYGGFLSLTAQNLASIDTIVGGSAPSWCEFVGAARSTFDLSDKGLTATCYLSVESTENADIIITDKTQVLEYVGSVPFSKIYGDQRNGLRLHLVGDTFTADERQALRDGGISFVRDASDDGAGNLAPVLHDLDGDHVQARNGEAVALDLGGNGSITDDTKVRKLTVTIVGGDANDRLDISTAGSIRLSAGMSGGSEIRDVTVPTGTWFARLYDVTNTSFTILFNGNATQAHIDNLIHALTYTNVGWETGTRQREIAISVSDGADKTTTGTVTVTHTTEPLALDPAGTSAPSTDNDDAFIAPVGIFRGDYSLNGGAGTDTLHLGSPTGSYDFRLLAEFSGIERIVAHEAGNDLTFDAASLTDIRAVVGPTNGSLAVLLRGEARSTFDLSNKSFTGVDFLWAMTFDAEVVVTDKSIVLNEFVAALSDGVRVRLVGDTFTAEERQELTRAGAVFIHDENDNGESNGAPMIAGLDGDRVHARNTSATHLDLGGNASLTDDMRIRKLTVTVVDGGPNDVLGISADGSLVLEDGLVEGGAIFRDATSEYCFARLYNVSNTSFEILFNGYASQDDIDSLVRALTYANTGDAVETRRQVRIDVSDGADKTSTATVTVIHTADPDRPPPVEPVAPSSLDLSSRSIRENTPAGSEIGTLSAVDPDTGDRLTYTLLDDAGGRFAIRGDRLMVADGVRLDYEQAQAHTVRVRVTDSHGLSAEKDFTIAIQDTISERVTGGIGHDVIKGGLGNDVLNGDLGNDQIWGGLGKDVLRGGAGKDVFVFDYKPNKAHVDRIMDFNVRDDSFYLENKVFKKLGKKGSLDKPAKIASKFFKVGTKAEDRDDHLIYNKKTGKLYYDENGSGAGKMVEIATLSKNLKLNYSDFFVV